MHSILWEDCRCMTCFITRPNVQPRAIFRGVWALSIQNHWVRYILCTEYSESVSQLRLWRWVFRITESVASVALSIQNHWVSCICGIDYSESLNQLHPGHWVFRITESVAYVALSIQNRWVSCVCGCLQDMAGGLHQEGKQKWWIWRHSAQVQCFQPAGHQGVPLQQTDRCAVHWQVVP